MTIDERIEKLVALHERLTERHEALTSSVEMLHKDVAELKTLVGEIAEGTARLLHTAEVHEERISDLEAGNRPQ